MNNFNVKILSDLLMNENNLLFSSLQISYFASVFESVDKETSKLLFKICLADLKNSNEVISLILNFGGDIKIKNSLKNCEFEHFKSCKKIVEYLIEIKEKSIINLKLAENKISEKTAKNSLKNIIIDESESLAQVKNISKKYEIN